MRLMQWQTIPSILDTENKNSIEEILNEKDQIRQRLTVLDGKQKQLDSIIEQGKNLQTNQDHDVRGLRVCVFVLKSKSILSLFRKSIRIVMNQMECVSVFYAIKKSVRNHTFVILINVLFE